MSACTVRLEALNESRGMMWHARIRDVQRPVQESPSFAESCTAKANTTKKVGSTSPAQEEACDVKIIW